MSKENYEPFENIPASKSFSDRALEWSAMYLTLIKAGKLSEDDDISKLTNFHKTLIGKKYYQKDLPALIESQNRLAEAIEKQNKIEEKKILLEAKKLKANKSI